MWQCMLKIMFPCDTASKPDLLALAVVLPVLTRCEYRPFAGGHWFVSCSHNQENHQWWAHSWPVKTHYTPTVPLDKESQQSWAMVHIFLWHDDTKWVNTQKAICLLLPLLFFNEGYAWGGQWQTLPQNLHLKCWKVLLLIARHFKAQRRIRAYKLLLKDSKPGLHLSLKHSTLYHTAYGRAGTFAVFPVLYNVSRIVKSPVSNRANRI